MRLIPKYILAFVAAPLLALHSSPTSAEWIRIRLDPADQTMSADIKEAALKNVMENIKHKKGIWIKGEHYLEDKAISVKFEDIPIKKGINRILSALNYSLMFDQDGELLGIFILGTREKTMSRPSAASRRIPRRSSYRRR